MAQLEPAERAALLERGVHRRYRRGDVLLHEGDRTDAVLLIESGWVKLCSLSVDGRETVLGLHGPGELVGELPALARAPRMSSVQAVEAVESDAVAGGHFRAFLAEHGRVAGLLLETMARRLRDANAKRVEFAELDVPARLARRLIELGERSGRPAQAGDLDAVALEIALPLSQEELGGWIGASRESVVKALQELRESGWIRTARRRITIIDLPALVRRGGLHDGGNGQPSLAIGSGAPAEAQIHRTGENDAQRR